MTLLATLGRRLTAARKEWGLSVEEVAALTRTSPDQIALYEAGRAEPYFDELRLLALLYQISLDELAGEHRPIRQSRPAPREMAAGAAGDAGPDEGTAAGDAPEPRAATTNGHARSSPPNGRIRTIPQVPGADTRPRSPVLRVAAIVLASLLVCGAVGYGAAVLWPKDPPRDVMETLSYGDAVLILVDATETATRRELAAARVFGATVAATRALRAVQRDDSTLGRQATKDLLRLRRLLLSNQVFAAGDSVLLQEVNKPLLELAQSLKDSETPAMERLKVRQALVKAVRLGLLALKKVDAERSLPHELRANLSAYVLLLRSELAK